MNKRILALALVAGSLPFVAQAGISCANGYKNALGHCVVPKGKTLNYAINGWPSQVVTGTPRSYKKSPDGVTTNYSSGTTEFSMGIYGIGQYSLWVSGSGTRKTNCQFDPETHRVECDIAPFNYSSGSLTVYSYQP